MQVNRAAALGASVGLCVVLGAAGYFLARPSSLGTSRSADAPEDDWFRQADLRMKELEETVSSLAIAIGNLAAQQRLQGSASTVSAETSSPDAESSSASSEHEPRPGRTEPDWMQALREKLGPDAPMRLDPGAVVDGAPDFYNPYTPEELARPEVVSELHDLFYLKRSMDEQLNALSILKSSMSAGQPEDFAFPEMLVIDALDLAESSPRAARHVLARLGGLRSPALKSKALLFVGDSDPEVRSEAVEALAVFAEEDASVQALLQQIAQSDPDHEVVSEALDALKEDD